MARFRSYRPRQFSWVDLMTPDLAASSKFYSDLFAWTYDSTQEDKGGDHTICRLSGFDAAGMGAMSNLVKVTAPDGSTEE